MLRSSALLVRSSLRRAPALAARPRSLALRSLSTLPAEPTFSQLPPNWRKLDYPALEVMDTSELKSLQDLLAREHERVTVQRVDAKEQQRKVLRVECDLDLKRIAKIETWIEAVQRDSRRNW